MNNEDIYMARKKYKTCLKKNEELLQLKSELEDLKENSNVKRYLELMSIEDKKIISKRAMISYSFGSCKIDSSKENKIYIYMGSYNIDNSYDSRSDIHLADSQQENVDYLLYTNIDSDIDIQTIKPKYRKQFENNYTVLKFSNSINIQKKYYDLQQFYFEQLLNIDLRKKSKILTLLKERVIHYV